jgi:hypothetical protein
MYPANRYSQTTCDDKVHTVPVRYRSRINALTSFPSRIYLRQKRAKHAKIKYVCALKNPYGPPRGAKNAYLKNLSPKIFQARATSDPPSCSPPLVRNKAGSKVH